MCHVPRRGWETELIRLQLASTLCAPSRVNATEAWPLGVCSIGCLSTPQALPSSPPLEPLSPRKNGPAPLSPIEWLFVPVLPSFQQRSQLRAPCAWLDSDGLASYSRVLVVRLCRRPRTPRTSFCEDHRQTELCHGGLACRERAADRRMERKLSGCSGQGAQLASLIGSE